MSNIPTETKLQISGFKKRNTIFILIWKLFLEGDLYKKNSIPKVTFVQVINIWQKLETMNYIHVEVLINMCMLW